MADQGKLSVALPQLVGAPPSTWRRYRTASVRFLRTKRLGAVGVAIVAIFVIAAAAAPYLPLLSTTATDDMNKLVSPNAHNWFGTDMLGRDVFSRTVWGARVSIFVGVITMLGASVIGAMVGVTSAYFGGRYDLTVQRFVDGLSAFPALLLALALVAAFGSSIFIIIMAMVVVFTPGVTRVVRSVSLSIKQMPYAEAARAIGATEARIMLRHILPNTFASLLIVTTGLVGSAIITEASLSFLGVGTAGYITWGGLLSGQVMQFFSSAPWIVLFPGFALTLLVFGINVFGDALRDVLDPRLRGR